MDKSKSEQQVCVSESIFCIVRKNWPYPYRKHKLVCGCYKVVDKVNYNLVATLLQGCDNLVSTL